MRGAWRNGTAVGCVRGRKEGGGRTDEAGYRWRVGRHGRGGGQRQTRRAETDEAGGGGSRGGGERRGGGRWRSAGAVAGGRWPGKSLSRGERDSSSPGWRSRTDEQAGARPGAGRAAAGGSQECITWPSRSVSHAKSVCCRPGQPGWAPADGGRQ